MGKDLFDLLIELSGLPEDYARAKFTALLEQAGYEIETLSLDQVRDLLANSLQDLVLEA